MAKHFQIFGNLFNGFVKKVNGVGPDEDGNVTIETSGGAGGSSSSSVSMFFIDDGYYVYSDSGMQNKVTREELVACIMQDAVTVVFFKLSESTCYYPLQVVDVGDYAMVVFAFVIADNLRVANYYTSEYAPFES